MHTRFTRVASVLGAGLALACCGGIQAGVDGGDGSADGRATDGAVPGACSTPEGLRICGGRTPCPSGDRQCGLCIWAPPEDIGLCGDTFLQVTEPCDDGCDDGSICLNVTISLSYQCAPYSLGVLYAKYTTDVPGRVRYADLGFWTGAPLPEPVSCPTFSDFRICGGNCGGCQTGEVCTGRSPLHPYGYCLKKLTDSCLLDGTRKCKDAGTACFVNKVEPEAQPVADSYGKCLPKPMCDALAIELPGGGKCVVQ